ncbi:phosphate acyltransferase PlsX [Hyphobacterium sp. HN65]|uniref:Phosphate acyltransferase n=1 Tax=Hyphobacterium lacteum TaxID=3116575 RepID=A0ABU7LNV0_9PROT|nr:phosphate acyltransferase PlsX [Hyphobacterium sp. HN65]MEE2525014.1 phosphate acyltransferase PlsX [Hyphobacterium sp. HN65]
MSHTSPIISVDAMGADQGPSIAVEGIEHILKRRHDSAARFLVHGDEAQLSPLIEKLSAKARDRIAVQHTDTEVRMTDKPSEAVRRSRGSSMWNALAAVKAGDADVVVSAGNTGALMAISKVVLRMKKGVHRPAISASWPTPRGHTVVLDVGANVECGPSQLVEFAIMGEAFHRAVHGSTNPTVGLLNVGQEELKGNDTVRAAARLIREAALDLNYHGFVEGDDISLGLTDVVVTDGFSGNIALKTAEGAVKLVGHWMREAFTSSITAKIGAAFLQMGGLDHLRAKLDPRSINGGVLLGLNGMVVKSHGGTDGEGFATALGLGIDMAGSHFLTEIEANLDRLKAAEEQSSESNS